jgi:hypothetical protein
MGSWEALVGHWEKRRREEGREAERRAAQYGTTGT